MAEITALVGAHHLIGIRLQRKFLRADDTPVGESANGLRAPRYRVGDFLPRRSGGLAPLASSASRAIAVFS